MQSIFNNYLIDYTLPPLLVGQHQIHANTFVINKLIHMLNVTVIFYLLITLESTAVLLLKIAASLDIIVVIFMNIAALDHHHHKNVVS